jgi:hypothetical protein
MTAPGLRTTVQDFGLGVVEGGQGAVALVIGLALGGTTNQVVGFGAKAAAEGLLVAGPALESVVSKLAAGASAVYFCRSLASSNGSASAVTKTGTGTGTVTTAIAPHADILVTCTTAGALGTAAFTFKVGNATASAPVTSAAGWSSTGYQVPGTFVTIVFVAGSYVAGGTPDSYLLSSADGTVTHPTGAGPAVPTYSASPVDAYDVIVEIMGDGGLGAGTFRYSIDGGDNYVGDVQIPSGGKFALQASNGLGTGVVLTFASTFVKGDKHTFTTTSASSSVSDVAAAFDAAILDASQWDMVHVVGTPANAAGAATLHATVATKMAAAKAAGRFARAMIECPQTESDSTIKSAFTNVADTRVAVCVGDFEHTSPLTGKVNRRNAAWAASARAVAIAEGEALHYVGRGTLDQVKSLYRDEGLTPGLDDARFLTLTTFPGYSGYYVTRGRVMAQPGSDFSFWQHGRVIDRACKIGRDIGMPLVGKSLRVNATTGKILEVEARRIEKRIRSAIEGDLQARGQISAVSVVVNRDTNIISTSALDIDIGVVPLAYADFVNETLRLVNPALVLS